MTLIQRKKRILDIIDRTNILIQENTGRLPERDLWRQVLVMGLKAAMMGDREELRWLKVDDVTTPGQFLWICKYLQIHQVKDIRRIIIAGVKTREGARCYRALKKIHRVATQCQR